MNTPSHIYQSNIANKTIEPNPAQEKIVRLLDTYFYNINQRWWGNIFKLAPCKGLYLHGTVGSGKTMLIDTLYNSLSPEKSLRMHFHEFMHLIHLRMKETTYKKDPLIAVTKSIVRKKKIIFLDELIVNDITNAMILKAVFNTLLKQKVMLILTSNTHPVNLYQHGINRQLFFPAIELIEQHFSVVKLDSDIDYRTLNRDHTHNYFHPITSTSKKLLAELFEYLKHGPSTHTPITIANRSIHTIEVAENIVWFNFHEIISPPRSYYDYIAITKQYNCIAISDLQPIISKDMAQNFCSFIDICYDKSIRVIIMASCAIEDIFPNTQLIQAIPRTYSRLIEMQKFT